MGHFFSETPDKKIVHKIIIELQHDKTSGSITNKIEPLLQKHLQKHPSINKNALRTQVIIQLLETHKKKIRFA